jgi:Domain of unknown function (DUF4174)
MTRLRWRRLGAGVLTLSAVAAGAAQPAANPLAAEQWKTRPLVIVAPSLDDPMIRQVRNELSATALRQAFDEREMVLYVVVGNEARRNDVALPAGQAAALLAGLSLQAGGPAEALLIGKDGGVKLRQYGQVDFGRILPLIDSMPMRRQAGS